MTVSENYNCPILLSIMLEPVSVNPCGHTFEKSAINEWRSSGHDFCPLDRRKIEQLVPATKLKKEIHAYIQKNPALFENKTSEDLLLELNKTMEEVRDLDNQGDPDPEFPIPFLEELLSNLAEVRMTTLHEIFRGQTVQIRELRGNPIDEFMRSQFFNEEHLSGHWVIRISTNGTQIVNYREDTQSAEVASYETRERILMIFLAMFVAYFALSAFSLYNLE